MTCNPPQNAIPFDRGISVRTFLRPLAAHLANPQVSEIAIVRPGSLFTRERGAWHPHTCEALTIEHLQALANALAVYNGLGLAPIMSVILPGGERGQIVQPPACLDGTLAINIRKHASAVKTLEELDAEGVFALAQDCTALLDADGLTPTDRKLLALKEAGHISQFLHEAVQARRNIVIGGATGSGKTTFARSLIERVPLDQRLITIEDVHELHLPNHRNLVPMMYGSAQGRVDPTQCVAACMRLSPDRIFLAELRGGEAWEYLTALNTGHPGSITTTHANSALDTYDRLALLIKQSPTGGQLDLEAIRAFLHNTIDIVLHVERFTLREIHYQPRSRLPAV
ncbi:P-type DNA transfer ATPase VirB11 [Alcaligenaceae bacterium]|nr:P-type DNA transfer ATPase VirB11 [Alcaligenaceae bacterium]